MSEDTSILTKIMLQADVFCSLVEGSLTKNNSPRNTEARLKIAQCRAAISYLQGIYEDGQLTFDHQPVGETFRHLVMSLMWVSFYGRQVDHELFRKLVLIESGFTFLLLNRIAGRTGTSPGRP